MNCQCEHSLHVTATTQGCMNPAAIAISPSWTICTACEATMGVYDPARPGLLACTEEGPYAGMVWHSLTLWRDLYRSTRKCRTYRNTER